VLDAGALVEDLRRGRVSAMPPPTRSAPECDGVVEPERRSVLVATGSALSREVLRRMLISEGYRVEATGDGSRALEELERDGFDLAIVDLELPVVDGVALLKSIRSSHRRPDLPVLLLSELGSEDERRLAHELQASVLLAKWNFDQRAFLRSVRQLIS